ncbi:MAG: SpoIIE family protein phosphatase [Acidobacteriota bacterium]|nr:SpoIIE family protein phosphatase [Acidobacteriota bacterium]
MFRLRITPAQGQTFDRLLVEESLVVGRSSESDLTLSDPFLSRRHSRLFLRDGRLFVEDLESRNGTLVNGQLIREPAELEPGDVLEISGSVLQVERVEPPRAGQSPARASDAPIASDLDATSFFRRASEVLDHQISLAAQAQGEEELRRLAERLKVLNDIHQALGRPITLEELLELILDRVFDHLRPEQGVIYLKRPSGELVRAASRPVANRDEELLASRRLAHEVSEKGLAALVLDAQTDERFASAQSIMISGVRSLVAAPLLHPEGTLGMIVLGSKLAVRQFTEEDMELLVSVASVAALYIRNLALAEEAAERRRLSAELALARRIQLALLPQRLPEVPGYDIHGGSTPSRGVSGDYYSVGTRGSGSECVLMVADVSGKGMAASLLTASLEAFSAGPIEDGLPPDEICAKLSRLLYQRTPPEKFATVFLGVLEPASGILRYANAGHNPPLLLRASGEILELGPTGVPIALLPAAAYSAAEIGLAPGDTLVLYTDGIVEANNPEDVEYGQERLSAVCRRAHAEGGAALDEAIERDLEEFARGTPYADDRTLVIVRRLPS